MLSPYHIPLLVRYFNGIDIAVSKRLLRSVPPSEPTLTEEFCALMDVRNQRRESSLEFDIDSLNAALCEHGDLIDADIRIETHQHAREMEAFVSQSDFALVINFEHMVRRDLSWETAYLMQAKRLFPLKDNTYGVTSTFTSADKEQHLRMQALSDILGDDAMKYCLYCPPTYGYEPRSAAAVRALHAENLWSNIYDFSLGLALYDEIRQSGGVQTGMWIADAATEPRNAADLHSKAFKRSLPLTWFLLNHFKQEHHYGMAGHEGPRRSQDQNKRVRAIARGDSQDIQNLINDLGDDARKAGLSPENLKVLPASTVTIRLRAGPEGFDMPPSRD